jgi:hypothetical protein
MLGLNTQRAIVEQGENGLTPRLREGKVALPALLLIKQSFMSANCIHVMGVFTAVNSPSNIRQ